MATQVQDEVKRRRAEYNKLKKRLERLIGQFSEVIEEDSLRLDVMSKLLEIRRLLDGDKPDSNR